MSECPFDGDCSCCQSAKVEIDRLRAERDKWIEYVTCDRAELVLELEAALARAEKAEAALQAQLYRKREEDRAVQEFLAQEGNALANNAEYKPKW
jgi:hypothetical protein